MLHVEHLWKHFYIICIFSFLSVFSLIFISAFNPLIGLAISILFFLVLLLTDLRVYILSFLISLMLLKNIAISSSLHLNESSDNFRLLLGFDFLIWFLGLVFVVFKFKLFNRLDKRVLVLLTLLVIYFLIGIVNNGVVSSATYLRTLSMPLIIFLVISSYSSINNIRFLDFFIKLVVVFTAFLLVFEIFFTVTYYSFFGVADFFSLKSSTRSYNDFELIEAHTRKLFNYFSVIDIYRPLGFSHQPISVGYIVSLSGCYLFSRKNFFLSLICLFCILSLGSKGPLILFIISCIFYTLNLGPKTTFLGLLSLLLMIILMGIKNYDPHVYSVLSSVLNLKNNIIGGGLGFGGVITTGTSYSTDFESISGDSGLAVCLNMMGAIGVIFFLKLYSFFINLSNEASFIDSRNKIFYYCSCCLVVNGVIQEEALSAYSVGFLALLLSILLRTEKLPEN